MHRALLASARLVPSSFLLGLCCSNPVFFDTIYWTQHFAGRFLAHSTLSPLECCMNARIMEASNNTPQKYRTMSDCQPFQGYNACTQMMSLSPGIRVGYARTTSRLVIYVAYHPNHAYRATKVSPHTITQLPRCNRTIAWKLSHHNHIYLGLSAHLAHLCRLTATAASRSSTREFPCARRGCVITFADMAQQKSDYKAR